MMNFYESMAMNRYPEWMFPNIRPTAQPSHFPRSDERHHGLLSSDEWILYGFCKIQADDFMGAADAYMNAWRQNVNDVSISLDAVIYYVKANRHWSALLAIEEVLREPGLSIENKEKALFFKKTLKDFRFYEFWDYKLEPFKKPNIFKRFWKSIVK